MSINKIKNLKKKKSVGPCLNEACVSIKFFFFKMRHAWMVQPTVHLKHDPSHVKKLEGLSPQTAQDSLLCGSILCIYN